ncbi:hypothetical protein SAY87_017971 [Trapa incisa]|uniref:Bifunctional inhibitor/plant lipid transfer protein/seed storage helical domain-containing protein n=1 Tax=Trapa incisa TaxID=236973 RepID=A0AAN7QSC7_9MYRT|nr:hypothetical protein SAY87_017971 [Trapa incisa]
MISISTLPHLRWLLLVSAAAAIIAVRADMNQDRAECVDQLTGLMTCLPYAEGKDKTPTIDCCSGLKQVLDKSKKCICVLIKDRDDPNLGIKLNATLALDLPDACHAPTNITQCIDLLQMDPKSTEAEIFEGSPSKVSSSTSNGTSSSSETQNGSSGRKMNQGLLVSGVASGAIVWLLNSNLIFYV